MAITTKIYVDTSVIGGIFDSEFNTWSKILLQDLEKIRFYNSINLKYGYPTIEIRSPREVLHEEERV